MAKMKEFHSSYGVSLDIQGTWHKFQCGIVVEFEDGDNIAEVKEKAHNTVQVEVEKQLNQVIESYNTPGD